MPACIASPGRFQGLKQISLAKRVDIYVDIYLIIHYVINHQMNRFYLTFYLRKMLTEKKEDIFIISRG